MEDAVGKTVLAGAAALLIGSIILSHPAQAQWASKVIGPDVFGNTTVIATVGSETGDALVIQCNQKDTLDLAFLSPATPSDIDELSKTDATIPAQLLIKVDQGHVVTFNAQLQQWNNNYVGVVASGRTTDIVAIVNAIGKATSQISVGTEIMGNQTSDTFGTDGSTDAMDTATTSCKLGAITASPSTDNSSP